ncbi:DsbC family protein [Rhodoferax sp. TH121]|uniref:DsbC family protein n=1 Tax=Rhodoferax sp. TH121 TaxID=2022803 RepID=UPI0020CC5BFA|nr:DsbC family protein [Rhodoferax sp. TH121]
MKLSTTVCAAVLALGTLASSLHAQEATIRSNLGKRIQLFKNIDEVRKTSIPGIYEIRVNGAEIYYSDAKGDHIFQGNLILTNDKELRNLTEERINKLTAVKFDKLPFKDAFTIVRGNGQRKLAVFEDPNCGYCKRFERDLQKVDNVTIYMFLYPILGPDSTEKSKAIWCSKDKVTAWQDWMLRDQAAPAAAAMCDVSPLARNVEFGKTYRINGTPTLIFQDGNRVPGAIDAQQIEKHLAAAKG